MPYTNVQFAGYAIDTAPRKNANGSYTYLGLDNPQQDIEARVALMLRAMNTAYDAIAAASPPNPPGSTLTVFEAPEFFFRGKTGAYEMDDVQLAVSLLQAIAGDAKWDNWVLLFGTILGTSTPPPLPWWDIFSATPKKEVYNFALIQEGGVAAQGPDGAHVVTKQLMSGIDFVAGVANPGGLLLGEVQHMSSGPSGAGREAQQVAYDGAGILTMDGITWAVDICLDHLSERLQRSPQLPGEEKVRIQLVPSCGASINAADIIAAPGGFIFNVDGHNGSSATLQTVAVPMQTVAAQPYVPVSNADIVVPGASPPLSVPPNALFRRGAGNIALYTPQAIPAAETVPGSQITLRWNASADYRFIFKLVYDAAGRYRTVMCQIESTQIDFHGYNYFLPLKMVTGDRAGQPVRIDMSLRPGSGIYQGAIWCNINVPDFQFQGVALEFSGNVNTPPQPAW